MADWGMTGRIDDYWFQLVDPFTLTVVDDVDSIPENSSITYGYYTDNLREAQLDLGSDTFKRNGREYMIRVMHRITLPGFGGSEDVITEECMGTFFGLSNSTEHLYGLTKQSMQCYGPFYRLTQDAFADDYYRPKGQTVEGGIRNAVEYAGGIMITKPGVDIAKNHTLNVWFQCGENRAESLRTIAGWANWHMNDTDYGEIVLEPYVTPANRPVVYTFEADENCMYVGGYTEERSEDEVYNRVIGYWSREKDSNGDGLGLKDRYVLDLPDGNPMSYKTIGRRMTQVLQISEPCPHNELVTKVTDYLNEHSTDSTYIEIEHVGIPGLRAGQVVRYQNDRDFDGGVSYLCEITQMDISSLTSGCATKTKMKVIGQDRIAYAF